MDQRDYLTRKYMGCLAVDEEWVEELFPLMVESLPTELKAWLVDLPIAHEPDGKQPYLILCSELPVPGRSLLIRPLIEGPLISGTIMWGCFEIGDGLLAEVWIGAALGRRLYIESVQ